MTEVFNKYKNGKIYKIFNTINDEIYVGSTIQSLSHRMIKHKDDVKNTTNNYKTTICKLMQELGVEHFYIELIEAFPCESKEELNAREGVWVKAMGTVNKHIPGRTHAESNKAYRDAHKEQIKEYRKQYITDNEEHIVAQRKDYYERTKEHKQEYQKCDKVKEWKKTKNDCPCGGHYINSAKSEHFKSMKHREYEESLIHPDFPKNNSKELEQKKTESNEARKQQVKEYRDKNKEVLAEKSKEYYEENKTAINEYKKEWYNKNKESVLERVKQHAAEHREEKNEYYKERYQKKKAELSIKTDCLCGGCYTVMSKNKHFKTKVHQAYEETIKTT